MSFVFILITETTVQPINLSAIQYCLLTSKVVFVPLVHSSDYCRCIFYFTKIQSKIVFPFMSQVFKK